MSIDTTTIIKETQSRIEDSLENSFEYNHSVWVDESADFLRKRITTKLQMIVLYVDLVGSTKMILDLPEEKIATIISSFSQEMGYIIRQHDGYVLKYVGDAVIGFFVAEDYSILVADNAVNCAKSMIAIIKEGINPILTSHEYPKLSAKIGIDFGSNVIVRYGSDEERSHVDILGPSMSIAAKMTSLAKPNQILIGEHVYEKLHPSIKKFFKEIEIRGIKWDYHHRQTTKLYRVYSYNNS